ncbi:dihydroneopterin aldolase [candidate division KSB1 bacterium]|nr:dihydroneopterin aldolase [bacterium]RKY79830.1 MAG: dihydroneopterin aldolase [candidate division KSB1 bacterium]RKY80504.1 MAG: dihydroneopterin aldolase [candidate division KSB1 bacterium]RKY86355.1 MAG: dihydroneopterin aldolase [candidate division KSB1 bacterium]RKY88841.1 MAG: dihydroneopterin aldolase [candidate division KSB1 bacterium]
MAKDMIRISNMVFFAYHGLEEVEKQSGQRFEVDVELILDLQKAGRSDNLNNTVDYRRVYEVVEEIVIEGDYNLLEAIAEDIAAAILKKFRVEEVVVRVRKPQVPLPGLSDGVEVEIVR